MEAARGSLPNPWVGHQGSGPSKQDQARKSNLEREQKNDEEKRVGCGFGGAGDDCVAAAVRGVTEGHGE